jgi:hypothetical protein
MALDRRIGLWDAIETIAMKIKWFNLLSLIISIPIYF